MKVQLLFLSVITLAILQLAYSKTLPDCDGAETACTTCRTGEYCPAGGSASYVACPQGWVCNPDALPVCMDITTLNPDVCGCPEGADGEFRDPYDAHRYFSCKDGNAEYSSCPSDTYFSETRKQCVELTSCTARGCYPIVEECGVYYCCELGSDGQYSQLFKTCEEGKYYDETTGTCKDPLYDCTGLKDGVYQDPLMCDVTHVCNNEHDLATLCCPHGQVYDPETHKCYPSTSDSGLVGICYDQYWEQHCRNRCTEPDQTYECHNKCSQFYFQCFENQSDEGGLHPSAMQCSGDQVYNPDTGECDRKENVADCKV